MVGKGDTPERIARREARFAREVAMLSKVQHKNLVKAMINSTSGSYFFPCLNFILGSGDCCCDAFLVFLTF